MFECIGKDIKVGDLVCLEELEIFLHLVCVYVG